MNTAETDRPPASTRGQRASHRRSAARLAAVQALYQMDMVQTDLADVFEEFDEGRLGGDEEVAALGEADAAFFRDLLNGIVRHQRELDVEIDGRLASGWRLDRLDGISRALLRAGAFELTHRTDVPARVTISEYVAIANAFFDTDEPGFINGVLDRLARDTRSGELKDDGTPRKS